MNGGTTPLPILYDSPWGLHPNDIFFGSPKIGTLVVLKSWTFISSFNQVFLDHVKELYYSPQKDLSNSVLHVPIKNHLSLALRGFVVGNQIFNLAPDLSFDHNSCILGINEQCIYTSKPFSNGMLAAPFGVCLLFQPRL